MKSTVVQQHSDETCTLRPALPCTSLHYTTIPPLHCTNYTPPLLSRKPKPSDPLLLALHLYSPTCKYSLLLLLFASLLPPLSSRLRLPANRSVNQSITFNPRTRCCRAPKQTSKLVRQVKSSQPTPAAPPIQKFLPRLHLDNPKFAHLTTTPATTNSHCRNWPAAFHFSN